MSGRNKMYQIPEADLSMWPGFPTYKLFDLE